MSDVKKAVMLAAGLLALESTAGVVCAKADIQTVSEIKIVDVEEDLFREPLEEKVSETELESLKELFPSLETEDGSPYAKPYYKLVFLDKNENAIDQWMITTDHSVWNEDGKISEGGDRLKDWLEALEESHDIGYEILDRAPGKDYFSLLSYAEKGSLDEITETNFEEGLDFKINRQETEKFCDIMENAETGEKRSQKKKYKYQIHIYSGGGADLYMLLVDSAGKFYTNTEFEIQAEELDNWFQNIVDKAENQDKGEDLE